MTKRKIEIEGEDEGRKNPHYSAFQMGDMVREKLTGVEGRVVGLSFWETGCTHVGVKRLGVDKDGKPHDLLWFDEPMVDLIEVDTNVAAAPNASKKPGGPLPTGMSHSR